MVNQRHHELWLIQRNENDWDWLLVWMEIHSSTTSINIGIFSTFYLYYIIKIVSLISHVMWEHRRHKSTLMDECQQFDFVAVIAFVKGIATKRNKILEKKINSKLKKRCNEIDHLLVCVCKWIKAMIYKCMSWFYTGSHIIQFFHIISAPVCVYKYT